MSRKGIMTSLLAKVEKQKAERRAQCGEQKNGGEAGDKKNLFIEKKSVRTRSPSLMNQCTESLKQVD